MEKLNLKPLQDRVVITRCEEEKTKSGIIIPDSNKEKPSRGTVICIGADVKFVKEGDTILFGKFAGNETQLEGREYLILKESEIFAVIQ